MSLAPTKIEGLVLTEVGDESIVYDSREGKVHVLNGTGAFIWRLLDGSKTVEDVSAELADQYETDRNNALMDVWEFINNLKKMGLIN